jgi:hypothetical protein
MSVRRYASTPARPSAAGLADPAPAPYSSPMPDTTGALARRRVLAVGRALLVLCCALALVFIVASRMGEGFSVAGLVSGILRGGLAIVLVWLGWRAPGLSGWVLVIVSLLLATILPFNAVSLMIAGPPLLVGALLIWGSWPAKRAPC